MLNIHKKYRMSLTDKLPIDLVIRLKTHDDVRYKTRALTVGKPWGTQREAGDEITIRGEDTRCRELHTKSKGRAEGTGQGGDNTVS